MTHCSGGGGTLRTAGSMFVHCSLFSSRFSSVLTISSAVPTGGGTSDASSMASSPLSEGSVLETHSQSLMIVSDVFFITTSPCFFCTLRRRFTLPGPRPGLFLRCRRLRWVLRFLSQGSKVLFWICFSASMCALL